IVEASEAARRTCQREAAPLLIQHATRRDPEKTKQALDKLEQNKAALTEVIQLLAAAGHFWEPQVEKARGRATDFLSALLKLVELTEECLQKGAACTKDDEDKLMEQKERLDAAEKEWRALLRSEHD